MKSLRDYVQKSLYKVILVVTVAKTIKKGVRKGYNIVLNNRIDSQY